MPSLLYIQSASMTSRKTWKRALISRHCPPPSNHIYLDVLARKRNLTSVSNAPLVPNLTMPNERSRGRISWDHWNNAGNFALSRWHSFLILAIRSQLNSAKGDRSKIRLRRKSRNFEMNSHISLRIQSFTYRYCFWCTYGMR